MSNERKHDEHIRRWLVQKGVRTECPLCRSPEWRTGDVIVPPAMPFGGGTALGGPSDPMIQVICANCGHVTLFSTIAVGLTADVLQTPDTPDEETAFRARNSL